MDESRVTERTWLCEEYERPFESGSTARQSFSMGSLYFAYHILRLLIQGNREVLKPPSLYKSTGGQFILLKESTVFNELL